MQKNILRFLLIFTLRVFSQDIEDKEPVDSIEDVTSYKVH